jgi:hypothetical protein
MNTLIKDYVLKNNLSEATFNNYINQLSVFARLIDCEFHDIGDLEKALKNHEHVIKMIGTKHYKRQKSLLTLVRGLCKVVEIDADPFIKYERELTILNGNYGYDIKELHQKFKDSYDVTIYKYRRAMENKKITRFLMQDMHDLMIFSLFLFGSDINDILTFVKVKIYNKNPDVDFENYYCMDEECFYIYGQRYNVNPLTKYLIKLYWSLVPRCTYLITASDRTTPIYKNRIYNYLFKIFGFKLNIWVLQNLNLKYKQDNERFCVEILTNKAGTSATK